MTSRDERISQFALLADLIESLPREQQLLLLAGLAGEITPEMLESGRLINEEAIRIKNALSRPSPHATMAEIKYSENPEWVRLPAQLTTIRWYAGRVKTCMHAPTPQDHKVVMTAAWKPDLVVCQQCDYMLTLRPGSELDRTCDLCGYVAAGGEEDPISGYVSQFGVLLYTYGACKDCAPSLPVGNKS